MNKIFFALLFFPLLVFSQHESGDSLKQGRVCKLVLYNGYIAEGTIIENTNDTLSFRTDVTDLKIPVKGIKFALNADIDISETVESEDFQKQKETRQKHKESYPLSITLFEKEGTYECDLYLIDGSLLKDVRLWQARDSSFTVVKGSRGKVVKYADVKEILFKPAAPFGYGYLYGSAIGFVFGFIPMLFTKKGAAHGGPDLSGPGGAFLVGLAFSIPAGLIGGVVGLLAAKDVIYVFENGISSAKINKIKFIIKKHS